MGQNLSHRLAAGMDVWDMLCPGSVRQAGQDLVKKIRSRVSAAGFGVFQAKALAYRIMPSPVKATASTGVMIHAA